MIVINPEFQKLIPALSKEEFNQLEKNILADGCRDPLVVWNDVIIDGHNRFQICNSHNLNYDVSHINFGNESDAKEWMILNQFGKRNISNYQRAELALLLKPLLAKKAEEQRVLSRSEMSTNEKPSDTREEIAKQAGVSSNTISKVERIKADATPEMIEQVKSGEITINKAYQEIRKTEIKEANEKLKAETPPPQFTGKYDVLVLDPPWPMEKIERDVAPNQHAFDYPTMSEEEMTEMELPFNEDSHVFMWTTHKFLPMALRMFEAWNVKYVLTMVWHKNGGFQPFNLPQYNCEFAIYGRVGVPKFIDTKAFNVCFNAPRGSHSEKPEEFYDLLRRVTDGYRIDIFNRRKIEGFDVWGNES